MTDKMPDNQTPTGDICRDKLTREAEAGRDLGKTAVSRRTATFLCAAFLSTICVIPLLEWLPGGRAGVSTSPSPFQGEGRVEVFALPAHHGLPTSADLKQVETALEKRSRVNAWLLPRAQSVLSGLGAGNEQLYIGAGNTLYYRPDVDYVMQPGFLDPSVLRKRQETGTAADPLPALLQLKQQLAARGIALIVMPAPLKPMIDHEGLTGTVGADQVLQNPSYDRFLALARAAGIQICDVTPYLESARKTHNQPQFLRSDTHWTPAAMDHAADILATQVSRYVTPDSQPRYHLQETAVRNVGDIASMLKLPLTNPLMAAEDAQILRVTDKDGQPWQPDHHAQVLLLGDSFTNIYSAADMGWGDSAGLAEQLSVRLNAPVDRIAINAGGSLASRKELHDRLLRGDDRLAGKRVVVYEFAMRDLSIGDWRILDLPPSAPIPPARKVPAGVVEGTIIEIAASPAPDSTVYPDCVVEARINLSAPATGQVLAYLWGLHGGAPMPPSTFGPGQPVKIRLSTWDSQEAKLGDAQRVDLDDADPAQPLYWAELVPEKK